MKPSNKIMFSCTDLVKIKEMFEDGYGTRKIAEYLHVGRSPLIRAFKELNLNNSGRKKRKTSTLEYVKRCGGFCKEIKDLSYFNRLLGKNGQNYHRSYCKSCEKIRAANYRKNNLQYIKSLEKEYRGNNRDKISKNNNLYMKSRRKRDPSFKLRKNFSSVISSALKTGKFGNSCSKYLAYSFEELKIYLESKFESWMNWGNYGKYSKFWDDNDVNTWTWSIDHIIPQSFLPYSSMNDLNFKKCWSLSNLRPLSSKQNSLKGNRA